MAENIANQISHDGIIKEISNSKIIVSIVSMASCASCSVKGACSASDVEEKLLEVKKLPGRDYKIGEFVTIVTNQNVGIWAVMFGYVFPLIVVVISLIVLTSVMDDEGVAGLVSILLLVPYYAGLYLSRQKMSDSFEFTLK
ncbi:MAG: SoxR reducing system RseC family protein [Bacteroidales bacterium]|nr:SoxR reducing system RseC family protein [Bacteroidales bacterium]